jgi:hypothetical protein
MIQNKRFGELFNLYRLRSGLDTYAKFGAALAEEGFVYEDSIFSKWKRGERAPKDRNVLLSILKIFVQNGAISDLSEADKLLLSLDLRGLNQIERNILRSSSDIESSPYFIYKPVIEPSSMFNNTVVTSDSTRFMSLKDISPAQLNSYWEYQSNCALAGYYSTSSSTRKSPEHYFEDIRKDLYSQSKYSNTAISITIDPQSGREYLSTTIRFLQGNNETPKPLSIMELLDLPGGWPHSHLGLKNEEIGEFDRLVIPNWAWQFNSIICRKGFAALTSMAHERGVKILYAIIFSFVFDMLAEAGINIKIIDNAIPYYTYPNAQELYPIAYEDYLSLTSIWQAEPKLCVFTDYGIGSSFI